jgi:glutamine amidotransferase
MCRFVAYIGKKSIVLSEVLEKPSNSLIQQSRHAKQLAIPLNADGFGIAWYKHNINSCPGIFKSTLPAWNDLNLLHISKLIAAKCFIGHVRASTIGNVSNSNCHPFAYKNYAFCHNGDIKNFNKIKRALCASLDGDIYQNILGQTDSEHFFAHLMNVHFKYNKRNNFINIIESFKNAVKELLDFQSEFDTNPKAFLNTVITDGKQLMATRYTTDINIQLSLYYADIKCQDKTRSSVLVASEPLGDFAEDWQEVPLNHAVFVNKNFEISIEKL